MSTRIRRAALVIGIGVVACTPPPAPPVIASPKPKAEPTEAMKACDARVALLRERLAEAASRPIEVGASKELLLPTFPVVVGLPTPAAAMIEVSSSGTSVDGQRVENGGELVELLDTKLDFWRQFHQEDAPPNGFRSVIQMDGALTVKLLVPVIKQSVGAGYQPMLMVRVPDYPKIPTNPPEWLTAKIATWHKPGQQLDAHSKEIAEAMTQAIGSCEGVRDAFAEDEDPALKVQKGYARVPDKVAACNCKLDVDGLEALLVGIATSERQYRVLPMRDGIDARPLVLSPTMTVDELARLLAKRPDQNTRANYVVE